MLKTVGKTTKQYMLDQEKSKIFFVKLTQNSVRQQLWDLKKMNNVYRVYNNYIPERRTLRIWLKKKLNLHIKV